MPYEDLDLDLSGKRAVVTGASRGIGRAVCERLAQAGAKIALVSRRRESLEDVAASLAETGTETLVIPANMSREEDVLAIAGQVRSQWGGIDVLVNNAGTNPVFAALVDLEQSAWDKVFDTNLRGPFLLTREVARDMLTRGAGSIINIASVGGLDPTPNIGAYCVSKAALISLTKAFARELGPNGIRVNCVAPGLVETKFADVLVNTPAIHDAIIAHTPLGRHGQPAEIAGAVHYLASAASSFMTGQVVVIDGGSRL